MDGRPKRIKKSVAFTSICVYNRLRVDGASVSELKKKLDINEDNYFFFYFFLI